MLYCTMPYDPWTRRRRTSAPGTRTPPRLAGLYNLIIEIIRTQATI